MNKLISVLALAVLLVGIVVAGGNLTNVNPMSFDLGNIVAGAWTIIEFGWDFADDGFNNPDSSLVLQVNFSSLEDDCPLPDCSVWKGDFLLNGYLKQYPLWNLGFLSKESALKCVESSEIEFRSENGLLWTEEDVANGTFYCYDPNDYLSMMELDRRDKVILNFSSHYALYPGEYNISIMPMEMEPDVSSPVMNLFLEGFVFGENDTIPIRLNVSDMYNVMSVEYEIMNPDLSEYYSSGWIEIFLNESSGFYEDDFNMTEHGLDKSGSYWIKARSCDILDNCGEL